MDERIAALIDALPNQGTEPETIVPENRDGKDSVCFQAGQTIANRYVVSSQISSGGAQSNVYIAQKQGRKCVVKYYHPDYRPDDHLIQLLLNSDNAYIVHLLEYGFDSRDRYFEVYDYYQKGSLEKMGKCSYSFLRDVVIPCVNEGLHYLHTLDGRGIVHGDLKPSNLFLSNDESKVMIGDFGVSSSMDARGRAIGNQNGTPEYAPSTVGFFGQSMRTPAYDYGSFGLVLIRLATGHSLFEGLSLEAIARKWDEGIRIPTNINDRLRRLIEGLLQQDEEKRFGYQEVKQWCDGEYIDPQIYSIYDKEDFNEDNGLEPMIFGVFDRQVVTVGTLKELSDAFLQHWEHAKRMLRDRNLYVFLHQFGTEIEEQIKKASHSGNEDEAVFRAAYALVPRDEIFYKGVRFGSVTEFVESLRDPVVAEKVEFIRSGMLEHFLRLNGYPEEQLLFIHKLVSLKQCDDLFVAKTLGFIMGGPERQIFHYKSRVLRNPDDLIEVISQADIEDVEALTYDNSFLAWLYSIGYGDRVLDFFEHGGEKAYE